MDIILYKYNGNFRKINKTLPSASGDVLTLSGYLKDGSSVLNPIIEVKSTTSIVGFNYAYIQSFSRYYFVSIDSVSNTLWTLKLKVDVLNTYKSTIVTTEMLIDRCMDENYLLPDDTISFNANFNVNILNLSDETQGDLQNFEFNSNFWSLGVNVVINAVNNNSQQKFIFGTGGEDVFVAPLITNMSEWSISNSGVLPYSYKYVCGMDDINTIKELYQQTEADFIKSIIVFPFELDVIEDDEHHEVLTKLKLGSTEYGTERFNLPHKDIFNYI